MTLGITKSYTPAAGDVALSGGYNTDVAALFNAFANLESQVSTLGGLTITPTANGTAVFKVTNATGTELLSADTTNSIFKVKSLGKISLNGATATTYVVESSAGVIDFYTGGTNILRMTSALATITGNLTVTGTLSVTTGATLPDSCITPANIKCPTSIDDEDDESLSASEILLVETLNINVAYATKVLIIGSANVKCADNTYVQLYVDDSVTFSAFVGTNVNTANGTVIGISSLTSGAHTIKLYATGQVGLGHTVYCYGHNLAYAVLGTGS